MKKRVRIYKAPDGEGKFINKTAQFLQKAQEGGMPSVDQIGYPGANQQSQQIDDNQLASAVLTDISNSEPRERIIIKLVSVYGKDPMEAQQFVDQMYQYVEQQKQSEIDEADSEDDGTDAVTMGADTAEEAVIEEQVRPTGTQMSNQIIDEWNDSDYDDQVASDIIMRYGGFPKAQEGMETPIVMPDISAYLPSGMENYFDNNVNPFYGQAWNQPTMDSIQDEEAVFSNYVAPELPEEKYGGIPSKKSYVNSVLKLVKKQMGGDSAAPASAKYNDDNSDPTGSNVRKKALDKFIGSVKNQSTIALAKKQAEEEYEQMMQQQQQMQQYPIAQQGGDQDNENPMHHLALFSQSMGDVFQNDQNQIVEAQFGGLFRRRNKLNNYTGGYNLPRSFQGLGPIDSIDVRKSGWLFNRPKEYSINFAQGSPMPGMGMFGQYPNAYGYGSRTIKSPAKRIEVENEAAKVNNKAKEEISNSTPDSTATTNAAKTDVTTTVSTSTQGTVASTTVPGNTTQTVPINLVNINQNEQEKLNDGIYYYPGQSRLYKKENDIWYVDITGSGNNYQELKSGDVESRIKSLEKNAIPYVKSKVSTPTNILYPNTVNREVIESPVKMNNYSQILPLSFNQEGGTVNDPFTDAYGNLQKFIGGGNENFTQEDLNDVYSKNTANGDFPMAQKGMMVRNLFPANIMPQQYTRMKGVPYDPATGLPVTNYIPGAGTGIKNINVTKSSWLTGKPKKYTITYGTREMDPTKQNLITLPGSGTKSLETQLRKPERQRMDVSDLDKRAQRAYRKGERQAYRNDKRVARHPELFEMSSYANVIDAPVQAVNRDLLMPPFTPEQQQYLNQSLTLPVAPEFVSPSVPFSADMLYNTSGPINTEMQYGGDLQRFIPKAQVGNQTPVSYTNNPAYAGMSDLDFIDVFPKNTVNTTGSSIMNDLSWNAPGFANEVDAQGNVTQYGVDAKLKDSQPNQMERQGVSRSELKRVYAGPETDVSMDFDIKSSIDPEAYINTANAGIRGVTGLLNRRNDARREVNMYDNLTSDNIYASDPSKDRGDYDANSGLYRPDEMGQKWNSRSKQYGGNIYQEGGMVEGDEVFMTEEEIEEFLANGGDLEFI